MKKIIIAVLVLFLIAGICWFNKKKDNTNTEKKQEALRVGRHSDTFNIKTDAALQFYFEMKNAFVNADTLSVKSSCNKMIVAFDSIPVYELKRDTAGIFEAATMQINDIKINAQSLVTQTNITEMRQDFRMVSENIYPFLKTIHYTGKIIYLQNCPMAFGEDKEGSWLSNTIDINNPYLGNKDPNMLHCGEIKDSIQ
jgi:hypothetical protein